MIEGIDKALYERVNQTRLAQLRQAVAAVRSRDAQLLDYDAQLRGDPWQIPPRYRGSSDYVDPITREHHLEQVARAMAVLRQEQWWTVNPTREEDADDAAGIEAWFNDKVAQYNLSGAIGYQIVYNAARHSYAVLYCGWRQTLRQRYRDVFVDEDGQVTLPEEREEGRTYRAAEEVYEEVEDEGLDFRVPHPTDVGFWPPDAQTIEDAEFIWERLYVSPSYLVDGIEDLRLDSAAVMRVVRGTQPDGEYRRERNDADGIDSQPDGMIALYLIHGRPPILLEGEKLLLPRRVRRAHYQWLVAEDEVLRCEAMPYRVLPYVVFPFLQEPGRLMGDGVPSLLRGLQTEGTVTGRFRLDGRDLGMSPGWLVPESYYNEVSDLKRFPGCLWPYPDNLGPGALQPMPFDAAFFSAALQDSNDLRMRAAQLFSAQARGSVTGAPHDRTATEIRNSAAGADEKFDLFLLNLHMGIEALARVILSHYQQFWTDDFGQVFLGTRIVTITPEQLEKRFRITAYGTSLQADPAARLERAKALYEFALQNPLVIRQMQAGDMSGIWAISATVLRHLAPDIRDPQTILGPEPNGADPMLAMEQIMAALTGAAQAGDMNAAHLLAQARAMMGGAAGAEQPDVLQERPPYEQDSMMPNGAAMGAGASY